METLQLANKVHDEIRQGEAYAPFANDIKCISKKSFI